MAEPDSVRLTFRLDAEQLELSGGARVGISTADLVAFSEFCDGVATAVSERAAWRFMAGLDASPEEWESTLSQAVSESLSLGQVSEVENGSIVLLVVVSASIIVGSLLRKLGEGTVVGAWEESAYGQKARQALRDKLFGGAAEAVEAAASKLQLPPQLELAEVAVEGGSEDGVATDFRLGLRKADTSLLEEVAEAEYLIGKEERRARLTRPRRHGGSVPVLGVTGEEEEEEGTEPARAPDEREMGV